MVSRKLLNSVRERCMLFPLGLPVSLYSIPQDFSNISVHVYQYITPPCLASPYNHGSFMAHILVHLAPQGQGHGSSLVLPRFFALMSVSHTLCSQLWRPMFHNRELDQMVVIGGHAVWCGLWRSNDGAQALCAPDPSSGRSWETCGVM